MALAVLEHPRAWRPEEVNHMVSKGSLARDERLVRAALEEAVHRFNNELLDDEERQLLLDRIRRLRRRLGVAR